jgi:hypothetical protein
MAAARRIWHSRISAGVTDSWRKLGENVGMGSSEPGLHAAFVASGSHLENLVDPAFDYVGVGVVAADGAMFVSQVFMQLSSPTANRPAPVQRRHPGKPLLRSTTSKPPFLFRAIQ